MLKICLSKPVYYVYFSLGENNAVGTGYGAADSVCVWRMSWERGENQS